MTKAPTMFGLIAADFACVAKRDPAARGHLETLLCYPGLHAIATHRVAHRLWTAGIRFPARFLAYCARLLTNIDIHPGARIGSGFFIDHGAGVVIGETAVVGEDCTLYHGVTLGGVSWSKGRRHPTLGDRVLVGAGAKVLGPIEIGSDARIGANSVVVEDVPPSMTVVGIPARIVMRDRRETSDPLRFDLDHHLMPDPVARVIERLADRVAFLEARLTEMRRPNASPEPAPCCGEAPSSTPTHASTPH